MPNDLVVSSIAQASKDRHAMPRVQAAICLNLLMQREQCSKQNIARMCVILPNLLMVSFVVTLQVALYDVILHVALYQ